MKMGFFSDLKEDLNQAVTELNPEAEEATAETNEEETKLDMEALLDNIDETVSKVNEEPVALKPAPKFSDETATITAGMDIVGDITSGGSVDLMGSVRGNITISGKLNILGSIEGDSKASEIYAENAKIMGEVNSTGSVKVGQSTVIIGNIFATSAVIAGAVKGDIDVKGPVVLDTSAIVMGNIKSKSVQINNGAVIEGICSQCYADVSPTSFFDEFKKNKK
jgi:cytoskeletal protein CcmA (bactofilin family)